MLLLQINQNMNLCQQSIRDGSKIEFNVNISDNFEVTSTKDNVIWNGKDSILLEKLKEHIQNCKLEDHADLEYFNLRSIR